jgi:glycosyltransferase involved in cell wall biosynthesis
MPLLGAKLPKVTFHIYGALIPASLKALACNNVMIEGYVEDVKDVFETHRIFIAPLLSGAGIKGKVLSAMAHGAPTVLSPIAAEGIPLLPETHCLIAKSPADWVAKITALYENEDAWCAMSENAKTFIRETYSFQKGVEVMRDAFQAANIY